MPKELISAQGEVTWSAAHSAYGRVIKTEGDGSGVESPFRLLGQVADDEAELTWTRFRCFDPEVGAWISTDPLEIAGGLNLYGFDGAPTGVVDPLGLATGGGGPHPKVVVLGEGMADIKKVVRSLREQGIDAKWYQAWSKNFPTDRAMSSVELEAAKSRNRRWIKDKIRKGYQMVDIGPDGRPIPSPFYALEKEEIKKSGAKTIPHPRPPK